MWMRVAIGVHGADLERAFDTYHKMSRKLFTHATPTLFNAGTPKPQMSSRFLLHMHDDSIGGIYKTLTDCAKISQMAGGIGLHVHNIRAAGSPIYGTGGTSNGLCPCCAILTPRPPTSTKAAVSAKAHLPFILSHGTPIFSTGSTSSATPVKTNAAPVIYSSGCGPDLFKERVRADEMWTLMDPHLCPGLPIATRKPSANSTPSTKQKARACNKFAPKSCGRKSSNCRWKPRCRTSSTRMLQR